MIVRHFFEDKLAQASYLIGCSATGEAIIIDPLRDIRQYLTMAASQGLRITAITETHIHADYLSGTRELAAATGAKVYLSDEGEASWKYEFADDPHVVLLHDGDVITVGNVTLKAMHTPGHTPEHMAFLLVDHPVSSQPHSLFSGDFIFVGDVGRPDLLERAAKVEGTMEKGARQLFRSLRLVDGLPDSLLIWPGHGAGSSCGKALGGCPVSTLGYERRTNWALLVTDEDRFVDEILSGQPEPPLYFKEMKRMNKQGPSVLGDLPTVSRLEAPVGQVADIRLPGTIRSGLYEGALAIPQGKSFTGWAGWVLNYEEPVTLIAENQEAANVAARDLATIGLDQVAGWLPAETLDSSKFVPVRLVSGSEIDEQVFILDVRGSGERAESMIRGSAHIPFGLLASRLDELPRDRKILVHCASGGRSLLAYSVLKRAGFADVEELLGGIMAVEQERPELILQLTH